MALVSVVIPCYNHQEYITETIQSVKSSTYKSIEIIIVDDGSVDNTKEVVSEIIAQNNNISYYYQNNAGPSAARNSGIRKAKGKYILPLDADDLISVDYIEKAVTVLESTPEVKLVYCYAEFFGEKNGLWKLPDFSRKLLARENMIFCSAIYRKSDWEAIGGYDERMTWGWEDWEFWINLLSNDGEVHRIPEVGFFYRIRKGSRRKSTNKEAKIKTIDLINNKHNNFIQSQLNGPLRYNRSLSRLINNFKNLF